MLILFCNHPLTPLKIGDFSGTLFSELKPHPLNPPLLKDEGKKIKRKGAKAHFFKQLPLPLGKGKGIKGIGLTRIRGQVCGKRATNLC
jgi:hypothetical protein